jgi:hypothetical protein
MRHPLSQRQRAHCSVQQRHLLLPGRENPESFFLKQKVKQSSFPPFRCRSNSINKQFCSDECCNPGRVAPTTFFFLNNYLIDEIWRSSDFAGELILQRFAANTLSQTHFVF